MSFQAPINSRYSPFASIQCVFYEISNYIFSLSMHIFLSCVSNLLIPVVCIGCLKHKCHHTLCSLCLKLQVRTEFHFILFFLILLGIILFYSISLVVFVQFMFNIILFEAIFAYLLFRSTKIHAILPMPTS